MHAARSKLQVVLWIRSAYMPWLLYSKAGGIFTSSA